MDTSETYIKMCEKAEEIQKLWERKSGDFAVNYHQLDKEHNRPYSYIVCNKTWGNDVWLPRQDQLQEMVDKTLFHLVSDFAYFCSILPRVGYFIQTEYEEAFGNKPRRPILTSMEQLWLAFVMKEKYSKVWDW